MPSWHGTFHDNPPASVPKVIFLFQPTIEMTDETPSNKPKCSFRFCAKVLPHDDESAVVECMEANCLKHIHVKCCEKIRVQFDLKKSIFTGTTEEDLYFCTKRCYDKIIKTSDGLKGPLPWNQDGARGKNDETGNSERLLLDWLLTGQNYNNYCGPKNGETKTGIANKLSLMFKERGVVTERTPKSIITKIEAIEQQFKKAFEWTNNTGVGVKESNEENFWEYVEKLCPYFRSLEPVMGTRSKMKALMTTDELFLDDSSDDDDNNAQEQSDNESSHDDDDICPDSSGGGDTRISDITVGSTPATLCKKRDLKATSIKSNKSTTAGKRRKEKKKNSPTSSVWDDDPLSVMIQLKQKEQKWTEKENEQSFKMNMYARVQKLAADGLSGAQILAVLGPESEGLITILNVEM